jgi:hypothetical protein
MRLFTGFVFVLLLSLILTTFAYSDGKDTYCIVTIDEEVLIDGKLEETFWTEVDVIDEFVQYRPNHGDEPELKTEVRMAKDAENLYISWVCWGENDELVMNVNTRDYFINNDDCIDVLIDTYNDDLNCYDFMVSAGGTQYDGKLINNGTEGDNSWDGVWESEVVRLPDRYIIEMAIPFRTLRYSRNNDVWGIQFYRVTHQGNKEDVYWAGDGNVNRVSVFGDLTGMTDLPAQSPMDITPYGVVRVNKGLDDEGTLGEFYEDEYETGLDVELRAGTWMTVNGTLNPDYAHIESDPFEINLSPDEIEYNEKRPFFLEGMEIYYNPLYLVYTRSMTDILAGVKAVGKAGGTEYAFFEVRLAEDDPFFPENYIMLSRVKQNIGKGFIGGMFINRWLDETEGYEDYNRVFSVDGRYQFGDLSPYFQVAKSFSPEIEGYSEDVEDLAYEIGVRIMRNRFNAGVGYDEIQKDFRADTSFIQEGSKDKRGLWGWANYQFMIQKAGIRSLFINGWGNYYNTLEGEKALRFGGIGTTLGFDNSMGINFYTEGGYNGMYKDIYGDEYNNYTISLGYYWQNQPWGGFNISYIRGDNFDVRFNGLDIESGFVLVRGFNLDFNFNLVRDMDEGENLWTNRLMATHYLTKDLFWRFIYDANSDNIHEFSGLFGYTYLPGSTMYIAYKECRNKTTGEMNLQDRTLFLKCSYQMAI